MTDPEVQALAELLWRLMKDEGWRINAGMSDLPPNMVAEYLHARGVRVAPSPTEHVLSFPPHPDGFYTSSALCSCGGFQWDADNVFALMDASAGVRRDWEQHVAGVALSPDAPEVPSSYPRCPKCGGAIDIDACRCAPSPDVPCDIAIGDDDWPGAHYCRTHRTVHAPSPDAPGLRDRIVAGLRATGPYQDEGTRADAIIAALASEPVPATGNPEGIDALIAELSESPLPGARYAVSVVRNWYARQPKGDATGNPETWTHDHGYGIRMSYTHRWSEATCFYGDRPPAKEEQK